MLISELEKLDLDIQDNDKYYTYCPKCSGDRKKGSTKSLMVTQTDYYVRLKCLHADQCEWNKTQIIRKDGKEMRGKTDNRKSKKIFIPEGVIIPTPSGSITYKYTDTTGNILFYVVRTKDKKFFPMTYTEDGELTAEAWPGKSLYNVEDLEKHKQVIVVEGEKAADVAKTIFTKAAVITWVGGAGNIPKGDWKLLEDREVTLWPDNDKAGVNAMLKIADLIPSDKVYIVDVSSLPEKYDLADDISKDKIGELYTNRELLTVPKVTNSITKDIFLERVNKIETGLGLGWDSIDKKLRLPQSGLTIIGGRSGHGKTTLMINMAVNMLKQTKKKVIYYSYEIPAHRMLLKLLMCWEGVEKSPIPFDNEKAYRDALVNDDLDAWKSVEPLLDNRLFLTDEPDNIDQLVTQLDQKHFEDSVIYIDYIQLIPAGKGSQSRYLIIKEHADALRAVANKRNQVIVTGSQLTDGETPYQDSVREGKDIQNAAELVLKVWNKVVAESQEIMRKTKSKEDGEGMEHYYNQVPGNFAIDVVKNRNGEPGKKFGFNLKFGAKLEPVNPDDKFKDF
jgi:replicative DNA helicase